MEHTPAEAAFIEGEKELHEERGCRDVIFRNLILYVAFL